MTTEPQKERCLRCYRQRGVDVESIAVAVWELATCISRIEEIQRQINLSRHGAESLVKAARRQAEMDKVAMRRAVEVIRHLGRAIQDKPPREDTAEEITDAVATLMRRKKPDKCGRRIKRLKRRLDIADGKGR